MRGFKKFSTVISSRQVFDFGEPAGIRTRDLLIKSQLLYRLSYRLAVAAAP